MVKNPEMRERKAEEVPELRLDWVQEMVGGGLRSVADEAKHLLFKALNL